MPLEEIEGLAEEMRNSDEAELDAELEKEEITIDIDDDEEELENGYEIL